ncbi:MAG: transglutaminase domain-containing protein [Chitinophagaceae bacterium]|nr:transglutaminase domain-containing protein [Chitinophagaceae bacterium]
MRNVVSYFFLTVLLLHVHSVFAQVDAEDEAIALQMSKKYKDNDIASLRSYSVFVFDKGVNALNDKVVNVAEETYEEFLALKKFGSMVYPEYYNKFIQITGFTKAVKYNGKYIALKSKPIDRSVTDEGIFFDDSRVKFFPIRFYQKGAVNSIAVKKQYADAKYLTRVFFRDAYPVKEKIIEFKVPAGMVVDFKPMNFDGYKIEKKELKDGKYTSYTFTLKDIAPYKSESKSIGLSYTEPHILIQVKSYETKDGTIKGFESAADVYAWNYRLYKMAGNEPDKLKTTVASITQGKTNDPDKIKAIYYWVQDNIKYIAYEDGYSGYIPTSVQEVLSKKYGDCKGMANLLTEMLVLAGYDARFTWIGTREIPYSQTLPVLCVNNHAISTLYYGGKEYFLDGTESYSPFGENAYRIQGKEAMISNKDKFEIKMVPLTTGEDHKIITKADFTLNESNLNGKVKVTYIGNDRKDFHQVYQDMPVTEQQDYLKEILEFRNPNISSKVVKTSDLKNREIPVVIEGESNLNNNVSPIDGDYYVNIDFFPTTLQRYMPNEKRTRGYDLDWVTGFEDELSLTIPVNKKFTDVPEKLEINKDGYSFTCEYIISGNKINLKKKLLIKKSTVYVKDFAEWKTFLQQIKSFSENYITVTSK